MSERLRRAVERLGVQPADRVLEIGCGHGVAATSTSTCAELETLDLGYRRFDKILALRVGLFHTKPDRARALAERWLAPAGTLLAEYDEPG